jgi:single-strand DNA-binding protein
MNKITFTGRLAADAETRFTPGGDAIANFRVASDVGFGEKKTTNWFNCQIWGKRGEALAPHLTKGQQVTVFGTLTLREWTNKEGAKQTSPDVRVDEIELQGGKREDAAPRTKPGRMAEQGLDDGEPIPF